MSKKIAVVGSGISGLTAAWLLGRQHDVTVFEAEQRVGGHTYTVDVQAPEGDIRVDIGFIVFNDRTYPNFNKLLKQLDIQRQPTSMGFSVTSRVTGVEYSGDGLGGVFAQKRNWLSPRHWQMVRDILRFNKNATALLDSPDGELPLADYLRREGYSERFISHYILPMGGAIWSCSDAQMEQFPARFFVRFFDNHGLLALRNRPQWYVVPGGSRTYIDRMLAAKRFQVRTGAAVTTVRRVDGGVEVQSAAGIEQFDEVVLACHSDQSSALLHDASDAERSVLSSVSYQSNEVVLHTDTRLLPHSRRCWSSWNALLGQDTAKPVQVTYDMNILQGIQSKHTFCVTLNASERIDPAKIIYRDTLFHPVFTADSLALRDQLDAVNGANKVWFCGAWCRNGFHEDGVVSALNVAKQFGESL